MAERSVVARLGISIESAILCALLGVVLLAPLPLGSVYPLSWWLMAAMVGLLLLAHAIALWRAPALAQRVGAMWPWLTPFALTAAWVAVQASPLTPRAWHHPLWQTAGDVLGVDMAGAISLNPHDTISALIRLLAYGGIFWLALQLCRPAARARAVFISVSVVGFAYAAYGLVDTLAGANTVLWYAKTWYPDSLTSTFVNRNNYAAYAGLGLICSSGMIVKLLSDAMSAARGGRAKALRLLAAVAGWRAIFIAGWMLILTALMLSNSRGGVLSSFAGLFALLMALAVTRAVRARQVLTIAALVMVAGAALVFASGDNVGTRLAGTALEREGRPIAYELTMQGVAKAPWLGSGYGTFEEAFGLIRDKRLEDGIWDKAHNTYLENALELGVPAASLLTLSAAALLLRCLIGLRARHRDAIYPAIGVGATVLLACHSLVDFSVQVPAIAATYALIMGAAAIQSWASASLPPER